MNRRPGSSVPPAFLHNGYMTLIGENMKVLQSVSSGDYIDLSDSAYPARLDVIQERLNIGDTISTVYGFLMKGSAKVETSYFKLWIDAGGFFCIPGEFLVDVDGVLIVIKRFGFRGTLCAGRIEDVGRLSYIDGCSDTILVMPPRLGDPVLNYLHFPRGVNQTQHTHPTCRLGVVARGAGLAYGPGWEIDLSEGDVFQLDPHEVHSFQTIKTGTTMDVIAFHPDSDWGPTDSIHPMLNRTYVGR